MSQLAGKRILVTGASSGIGRAVSILASREGASVTLLARNQERLDATLASLEGSGHETISCDLTDEEQVKSAVASMTPYDGVVFCAGINEFIPLTFVRQEKMDAIFSTNCYAPVLLTRMLVKKRLLRQGASLVYISSLSSVQGVPGTLVYASSKAALTSAVRVIASELAPMKIRANAICPGIVRTEMIAGTNISEETFTEQEKDYPLGLGTPEDVAGAVIFHLSDASRWLTGQSMVLDGGNSLR